MKILVYIKNSDGDKRAISVAAEHAKAFNASVDLISVISENSETPMGAVEKAETALNNYIDNFFKPEGISCVSKVIMTTLAHGEAVVQYADNHHIDEIIMSIRKRSKVGKLFFGSTTQFVILEAPCMVITVK
ncbi:putative Universal stress protein in QAH/OAS sulfhydrylase 3'region [Desulfamplus magnetovallimortis]|uniref:Putative Universal stress protein in QAH/OAS sulfhydrylase 3'region n=1 Tax=Desulfamplus magnetovallimortis TaxID=1246637 RepID=A0A1W1HCV7_9BACT|nr:universal stress protein [Desulfamplus magnetovallimortis]SLM30300.1 putative Universal stress protein in QAH/OAS sulfhydrylase 3'region [Desulfamplus magnetovallimortis]